MKYNLSKIARRANALTATMTQSAAWKRAWAEEKLTNAESALFILEMKDRWNDNDRAEANALRQEIAKQKAITAPALRIVEAVSKTLEPMTSSEYAALCRKYAADPAALRRLQRAHTGWAGLETIADLRETEQLLAA